MKRSSKLISLLLLFVLLGTLLTACGKKNDFLCADVINRSPGQQKWLKAPYSNLILNPDAVNAEEGAKDPRDLTRIPLNFGITDSSGNLLAGYDDVFFILEYASANGLGAELVKQIQWDGVKGLSKVDSIASGPNLSFTIPAGFDRDIQVRTSEPLFINYNDDKLYLYCDIAELPEGATFSWMPAVTCGSWINPYYSNWTAPGQYMLNLQEAAIAGGVTPFDENGTSTSINLVAVGEGTYRLQDFSIVRLRDGYHAAETAASTEWAPYYMKSSVRYPNESSIETVDFFLSSDILARKITPMSNSDIAFVGKIYGTCSYDSKENVLCFENGNSRYVIFLRKKGTIEYFATYEDLLSDENILESADGASYWALRVSNLTASDNEDSSFYVAVAASDTKSFQDLITEGKDAVSIIKIRKVYMELEDYWDAYIAENDVSKYITVIPEE